ncbi:MAG: hypothetical protein ACLQGT_08070 [Terracidiphilus sp.]
MSTTSVTKAKKFFVNRIMEQAKRDGVSLSEIEVQMLGFAETNASAEEMEAAAVFERDFNDEEYEAKVAKLLKCAYQQDKESGKEAAWDSALTELAEEDMYLLVMIERAGIRGSNPFSYLFDWRFILGLLPACIAVSVGIVIAFTPFGARLVPNEFLRLALLLLMLVSPLLIGKMSRKTIG